MPKDPRTNKEFHVWLDMKMNSCNWSIKDGKQLFEFPFWLLKYVYSGVNMVNYKGKYVNGRVRYGYIPEEYTIDKIPIIIRVDIELNPPPDARLISYYRMKQIFCNNKFED